MSSTDAKQNVGPTSTNQAVLPSSPVTHRYDTPTSDGQQSTPTEYDTIKAVLIPYWHIFTTVVQNVDIQQISSITQTDGDHPSYTCHSSGQESFSGAAAFPPDIPPEIQVAIQKLELCDLAVHTLLPYLQNSLQRIGERVDWTMVTPHRKILTRYADDVMGPVGTHSVCVVTSASGETFICGLYG